MSRSMINIYSFESIPIAVAGIYYVIDNLILILFPVTRLLICYD